MNVRGLRFLLSLIIVGCITGGCSRFSGYKKTDDGLYYKFYRHNEGQHPDTSHIVQVNLSYRYKDSILFSSNNLKEPMNLMVNRPDYKGDFNQALMMMTPGDSASFLIRADSFFFATLKYNRLPKIVSPDSYVTVEVGLTKMWTKQEQRQKEREWILARKNTEREDIQKFIKQIRFEGDTTPEGLYFKITRKGEGPTPKPGDLITLKFSVVLFDGTELYSSWDKGVPMTIEFGRKFDTEGINIALSRMNKGSVARLIIPSKLAFGEKGRPPFIPPYSPLLYDVEIVDIQSKDDISKNNEKQLKELQQNEQRRIEEYLAKNNLKIKPQNNGIYFIELKKGQGEPPQTNQAVRVHYTGWLLDGTKFDSSVDRGKPFEFILGRGNVIKGWDLAVAQMRPGSKVKVILPSQLAYGERGAPPKIPPYAPLVFEIELLGYE